MSQLALPSAAQGLPEPALIFLNRIADCALQRAVRDMGSFNIVGICQGFVVWVGLIKCVAIGFSIFIYNKLSRWWWLQALSPLDKLTNN